MDIGGHKLSLQVKVNFWIGFVENFIFIDGFAVRRNIWRFA